MIRRLLALLILLSLLPTPVEAQQKPLVTVGGQTRQLPDGTPLTVNSTIKLPELPNGDAFWTGDTTPPRVLEVPGRAFFGTTAAESAGQTTGTNWVSSNFDHYPIRSNTLTSLSKTGGTAVFGATRNSDRYRQPALATALTIWGSGQTITAGQYRGRFGRRYVAATSGTTGGTAPVHTTGTVSDGGVSWTYVDNRSQFFTPIGVAMWGWSDVDDGEGTWAGYADITRGYSGGTSFGLEFAIKNQGTNEVSDPFNFLPGGSTIGAWFAAGGDPSYGGPATSPSTAAITIGRNSAAWNTGIVFGSTGLQTIDGRQRAMALAPMQALQWYRGAGAPTFELRSDGGVAGRDMRIVSNGYSTEFRAVRPNGSEEAILGIEQPDMSAPNSRVNQLYLQASTKTGEPGTGFIKMQAAGYDNDISVQLIPKGNAPVQAYGSLWSPKSVFSSLGASLAQSPNYVGNVNTDSRLVAVDGSPSSPGITEGAVGYIEKSSSAPRFQSFAVVAHKSNASAFSRATASYGECVDPVGGTTSFCEGGRFQSTVGAGSVNGSGYGAVCAAGAVPGAITPQYIVGCEGNSINLVGPDAVTYAGFNKDRFSAAFVATNGCDGCGAFKADAGLVINPYSEKPFRTGVLIAENSVDDTGVAFRAGASMVNGIDMHMATFSYSPLWLPNDKPVRISNAAGTAAPNVLTLNASNDLDVGAEVTGSIVLGAGLRLKKVSVSDLPTCNAGAEGTLFAVNDNNGATFNAAVASGGTNHVMAYCNGTNWTVH
ncbi:hypothetical protein [Sphingobium xenophagum]|uniref:hypothetical protein n=1 Tax=Sphingobium xenophagum TaxID=121428 RepID=UPI0002EAB2F9|nr:hypothetical protein [Sphingobium xenophagum]